MNPQRLFRVFLARWKTVLFVFIIAAAIGVTISYYVPKNYTSSSSIVVDAKIDPVAGMAQIMMPNFLTTQTDIIKSTRVGNRVIRSLKLDQNANLRAQYVESKAQTNFDDWLSSLLQKALVAEVGRGSNVLKISYTSADPGFAAIMANAFVKAYLDTVLEMRIEPARQYAEFFDERSKGMRDAVEKAQSKLSAYQKENGLIGSDERSDVESIKLTELSQQLLAVQASLIEATSKQNQAQISADKSQEVIGNGLINNFKSELARQETRLQEISSRLGDAHPQVIDLKVVISDIKLKIDLETKRITSASGVNTSVYRQREQELRKAVDTQRAKVLKLKDVRDDLTVLQRDLDNANRAYDNVRQRLSQSTLESQNQQTSISILTKAEPSNESSNQIFIKNSVKALAVALGLSLLAALLMEFFDKRIRVSDDVTEATDLNIIGVMPRPDREGLFGKAKPTQLQRRLLRQLPRPS